MGERRVEIGVGDATGAAFEEITALVDTGATYTWLPRDVLQRLGHEPEDSWGFVLANGARADYGVKWVLVRLNGRVHPTPVVFGDVGTAALLGIVTLGESRL